MATTMKDLSQHARRIYFVVGLGFVSLVVGSLFSIGLLLRLGPRLHGAPWAVVFPIELVLKNLWCLALLPLFVYAAARVVALRPWSTALGALAAGEVFLRALRYIQGGADALWGSWTGFVAWLVVLAAAVFLTRLAVVKGRVASQGLQAKAQRAAQAKASEYAAFAAAAEQQAERNAQAEAARADANVEAGPSDAAAAEPGEGVQEGLGMTSVEADQRAPVEPGTLAAQADSAMGIAPGAGPATGVGTIAATGAETAPPENPAAAEPTPGSIGSLAAVGGAPDADDAEPGEDGHGEAPKRSEA